MFSDSGQKGGRAEDAKLIAGKGGYTDDIRMPGQAYAAFLRSPVGHALIRHIDIEAASKMPGVLGIFTASDLTRDGVGDIATEVVMPGKDGKPMVSHGIPVLARERVRYVGEAVAIVVAETQAQALDGTEAIIFHYDELPAMSHVSAAGAEGAALCDAARRAAAARLETWHGCLEASLWLLQRTLTSYMAAPSEDDGESGVGGLEDLPEDQAITVMHPAAAAAAAAALGKSLSASAAAAAAAAVAGSDSDVFIPPVLTAAQRRELLLSCRTALLLTRRIPLAAAAPTGAAAAAAATDLGASLGFRLGFGSGAAPLGAAAAAAARGGLVAPLFAVRRALSQLAVAAAGADADSAAADAAALGDADVGAGVLTDPSSSALAALGCGDAASFGGLASVGSYISAGGAGQVSGEFAAAVLRRLAALLDSVL